MVTREPEWTDQERAWMVALAQREAAECGRCGGDLVETTDYNHRYIPLPPLVCLRCLGLHAAAEQHAKAPNRHAMIHRVERRTRPKPQPKRKGGR